MRGFANFYAKGTLTHTDLCTRRVTFSVSRRTLCTSHTHFSQKKPSADLLLATLRQRKTTVTEGGGDARDPFMSDSFPAVADDHLFTSAHAPAPPTSRTVSDGDAAEMDLFGVFGLDETPSTRSHVLSASVAAQDDVNATLLQENTDLWLSRADDHDVNDDYDRKTEDATHASFSWSNSLSPSDRSASVSAVFAPEGVREGHATDDGDDDEELALAAAESAALRTLCDTQGHSGEGAADAARHDGQGGENEAERDSDPNETDEAEDIDRLVHALLHAREGQHPQLALGADTSSLTFFSRQELEELLAQAQQSASGDTQMSSTAFSTSVKDAAAMAFDSASTRSAEMESVGDALPSPSRS